MENLCINCNREKEDCWAWFCHECRDAKEEGYRKAKEAGAKTWGDVIVFAHEELMKIKNQQNEEKNNKEGN